MAKFQESQRCCSEEAEELDQRACYSWCVSSQAKHYAVVQSKYQRSQTRHGECTARLHSETGRTAKTKIDSAGQASTAAEFEDAAPETATTKIAAEERRV